MTKNVEAAWQGTLDALREGRDQAASEMLSHYITALSNVRSGAIPAGHMRKVRAYLWWGICAELTSWRLRRRVSKLDHNQCDVLAVWEIETSRVLPPRVPFAIQVATIAFERAKTAYSKGDAKPHQMALAYATKARALLLLRPSTDSPQDSGIKREISSLFIDAEDLEFEIRGEADLEHGLRQLVRVLKESGSFQAHMGELHAARRIWEKALVLARGEANTRSQAKQIELLLQSLD